MLHATAAGFDKYLGQYGNIFGITEGFILIFFYPVLHVLLYEICLNPGIKSKYLPLFESAKNKFLYFWSP